MSTVEAAAERVRRKIALLREKQRPASVVVDPSLTSVDDGNARGNRS